MRSRRKADGRANGSTTSVAKGRSSDQAGRDDKSSGHTERGKAAPSAFAPGLYVVATPIGNARDITLRALDLLTAADIIACEDTRITRKLLTIHDIATPTLGYHDHNAASVRPRLMQRLKKGEIVALVSDAGTPLISDPGYRLVNAAREAGIGVTALPGPSAPLAALAVAGLPTDRFLFVGFLPAKSTARRRSLAELAGTPATLVLFEAPGRLAASLADMAAELGPREAAVARELTKKFEEVRRAPLPDLAAHYRDAGPPKGEVVVLVAPAGDAEATVDDEEIDRLLATALRRDSIRDAAAAVAAATGRPRRALYARALALAGRRGGR
ncbi:MAG: 16S rRNA (cytidine(1402)-2'-O)-methyltransferase [Alphaproteobacteria bacterium]|jgi:16S rRNA (cytidine1402-2'-O)-methyltransferase|nr:16S rRNA (cytidine(1402)-2'-O)-methyltransferase [Alphaproteobacteria bacterium]MDP6815963.1 16S rRNA (cytidine(1402)-2'-O)-methyltransferase [Alphaproteobacteria bacterium]